MKWLIGTAVVAAMTFGSAGVALAQPPTPVVPPVVSITVSPPADSGEIQTAVVSVVQAVANEVQVEVHDAVTAPPMTVPSAPDVTMPPTPSTVSIPVDVQPVVDAVVHTVTSEVEAAVAQPVLKPPVTPPASFPAEVTSAVNALIQSIMNFIQGLFG